MKPPVWGGEIATNSFPVLFLNTPDNCALALWSTATQGATLNARTALALMKIFFTILVFVAIAASVYADYRWRRWMAARRQQQDRDLRA